MDWPGLDWIRLDAGLRLEQRGLNLTGLGLGLDVTSARRDRRGLKGTRGNCILRIRLHCLTPDEQKTNT